MVEYENYWRQTEPVEPGPPLDGDIRCDVCVVGAGYTGLWSAHFLAEAAPGTDIHVLDAGYAGAGASGLNGGFVQMTGGKVLRRLLWYYGREKAAGVYRAVARSSLEIGRFCRQYGVDAHFENNGFLQVATDAKGLARLQLQLERADRAGMRGVFNLLDAAAARERIGSPSVAGAMRTSGALVNPHRLARGLARVVREQGVRIHEQSPVTEVVKEGGTFVVRTPRGTVRAEQVVLATEAWQSGFPELFAKQMPVWNYLMVSEPLDDATLDRVAWPGREGVVTLRSLGHAARLTPDRRVLWAGGPWFYFGDRRTAAGPVDHAEAYHGLRAAFDEFFPAWRGVEFTHAYGGPISWSHSFIPQFGRTPTGLVYGHGYTGSGIAASHTGGKIIRDIVLGRTTEYTELAFVTVNQPKFLPGWFGDRGVEFFLWRQRVGDRLPLLLPHRAALSPGRFFGQRAARRNRVSRPDRAAAGGSRRA